MKNDLARGVRQASDFLMALQLTGAAQDEFPRQPATAPAAGGDRRRPDRRSTRRPRRRPTTWCRWRSSWHRYETLVAKIGEQTLGQPGATEARSSTTWLKHGRAIRAERSAAAAAGGPDFLAGRAWGGVTIVYRKRLQDSPAYRLNHEEVIKSLEEGIRFAERLNPVQWMSTPRPVAKHASIGAKDGGPSASS